MPPGGFTTFHENVRLHLPSIFMADLMPAGAPPFTLNVVASAAPSRGKLPLEKFLQDRRQGIDLDQE